MAKTRAIRFSTSEAEKIEEFLQKNSFFDFSSLARTAIMSFIETPTVAIQPVHSVVKKSKARVKIRGQKHGHA